MFLWPTMYVSYQVMHKKTGAKKNERPITIPLLEKWSAAKKINGTPRNHILIFKSHFCSVQSMKNWISKLKTLSNKITFLCATRYITQYTSLLCRCCHIVVATATITSACRTFPQLLQVRPVSKSKLLASVTAGIKGKDRHNIFTTQKSRKLNSTLLYSMSQMTAVLLMAENQLPMIGSSALHAADSRNCSNYESLVSTASLRLGMMKLVSLQTE